MKSKRSTRISSPSIILNDAYTLNDLMYIHSYHKTISKVYDFLLYYRVWSKNKVNYKSFSEIARSQKMNSCTSSVLKKLGYADDNLKWKIESDPTMGDAIIIRLAVRKYNLGNVDKL